MSKRPAQLNKWILSMLLGGAFSIAALAGNIPEANIALAAEEETSSTPAEEPGSDSSSSSPAFSAAGFIKGEQVTELGEARIGAGYSTENSIDAENNFFASIAEASFTPTMQTYTIEFSSEIRVYYSLRRQVMLAIDDPTYAGEISTTGELPTYQGYVYSIQIPTSGQGANGTIYIPAYQTKAGFHTIEVAAIYPNAVDPETASGIEAIYIPSTVETAFEGALTGLSDTCQLYFEADSLPEDFEEGYTDVPEENIHFGAEIAEAYRSQAGYRDETLGNAKENFMIGFDAGDENENQRQLLNMTYDVVKDDGTRTTYNRDLPISFSSLNAYCDVFGTQVGTSAITKTINLPKDEGESIDPNSIVFSNIYLTDGTTRPYLPDYSSPTYYVSARVSYRYEFDATQFASFRINSISTFAGYTLVSVDTTQNADVYQYVNPTMYESLKDKLANGTSRVRFGLTGLNSTVYSLGYEGENGEIKQIEMEIRAQTDSFLFGNNDTIGFIFKNSNVGDDFSADKIRSFGFENYSIRLDVIDNGSTTAPTRTSGTVRFGEYMVMNTGDEVHVSNVNTGLLITFIVYTAIMALLTAGLFIYKQQRFKNDEFRRLNPKSFFKNAGLAYLLFGFITFFIAFCVARWGFLANNLVVYNPADVFVIIFGIIAIIAVGYYVRWLFIAINNEKARRKAIKLKLDQDINDDDGTK